MSTKANEKIQKVCFEVKDKLESLGIEQGLQAEIDWCLGSYAADQNPAGLYEKAEVALEALSNYKASHPRKVSKKLIEDITKVIRKN